MPNLVAQARRRGPPSAVAAAIVVVAFVRCHAEPAPAGAAAFARATTADTSASGTFADAALEAPSLKALQAMAESLAPGMREAARAESSLPASIPLLAANADACVRAVFVAKSPVVAALVTDGGSVLAITQAGASTTLDTRGPVCFHKGQSAHIEVQGQADLVRYVVWMTPP